MLTQPNGPLVSVGVPVRNGSSTLQLALETLAAQTYTNLEIIISDNASDDDTGEICRAFAARDARVRYVRQPDLLAAFDNFRFVFDASHGEFFLWAAYDDLRSPNYVGTLVKGFEKHPDASLVFSDLVDFFDYDSVHHRAICPHDFQTEGVGLIGRLRKHTCIGCEHVYGLMKSSLLREYDWYDDLSADVVLLYWLATRAPLVYEPGAIFYYRRDPGRTPEVRALDTPQGRVVRFQAARTSWACARAISDALRRRRQPVSAFLLFPLIFYFVGQGLRGWIASMTPRSMRLWWRRATGAMREERAV